MLPKPNPFVFLLASLASALVPTLVIGAVLYYFLGEDDGSNWFWTTSAITFGAALLHLFLLAFGTVGAVSALVFYGVCRAMTKPAVATG